MIPIKGSREENKNEKVHLTNIATQHLAIIQHTSKCIIVGHIKLIKVVAFMFQVDEVLSPNSIDLVDTKVLLTKINVFKFQYYLNGKSLQLSSLFVIFL